MRVFDYQHEAARLIDHKAIALMGGLREFVGKQSIMVNCAPDVTQQMMQIAFSHAVAAGARTCGIAMTFPRITELLASKMPINESEHLVCGYGRALQSVFDNEHSGKDYLDVALSLHRIIFANINPEQAGKLRTDDAPLIRQAAGRTLKASTVAPDEIKAYMDILQAQYTDALREGVDPIFAIPLYILDFIKVMPVAGGVHGIVRLMIAFLLQEADYPIARYVSIEYTLEKSNDEMLISIAKSLEGWERSANDVGRFFLFFLNVIHSACETYSRWVMFLSQKKYITKRSVIHKILEIHGGNLTKQMIREFGTGISDRTIEVALQALLREGSIEKVGAGRGTAYHYLRQSTYK